MLAHYQEKKDAVLSHLLGLRLRKGFQKPDFKDWDYPEKEYREVP